MKKATGLFLLILLAFSFTAYSTTWTVTVQNFMFTPSNLPNVIVGDTIKWEWINGSHTTTSTNIPQGAPMWDSPMNDQNPVFRYIVTVPGSYSYVCTPHAPDMAGSFTANVIGITPLGNDIPKSYRLNQNYPNPFNPVTNIEFSLPKAGYVKLSVMNLLGQQVEVLVNKQMNPGNYNADWDASAFPSGIYFYKLEADGYINTKRMILIK